MTADEIRSIDMWTHASDPATRMLAEITAQLAEANTIAKLRLKSEMSLSDIQKSVLREAIENL
jgi:hypothetical protein